MSHHRPAGPVAPSCMGRAGHRRPSECRPGRRALRFALVGVLAGVALVGSASPVLAAPAPPNPTDGQVGAAQTDKDAAAAEVGRIAGQLAVAEAELQRVVIEAEAAGTAYMMAEEALGEAQSVAEQMAAELQAAAAAVIAAEGRIARFSRDSYMKGSTSSMIAALLDSAGPSELIQRAALLDYVAANEVDVLGQVQVARTAQADADSSARAARDEVAGAEAKARAAKAHADAQLATEQGAYAEVAAQKAAHEAELKAAEIRLLELQGARNAYQQWMTQKQAEEAAAAAAAERSAREAAEAAAAARKNSSNYSGSAGSSRYAPPFSGRVASCFGARWGTLHNGLDVASPIGTPLYAPISGTVKRAGPATGFGLAVYLLGDDGAVYVYGHINDYFVRAGDRVVAGEQIAEVGNRGNSTGPHVHLEVHPSGVLYGGAADPAAWLDARGISVGACGR